jgi:DNA-binding transcriptional MerR regulator
MVSMMKSTMSIGELSKVSGLSTHTLRYYERLGILKPADRGTSGHRQYRADAVAWLDFVLRLKITGMPLAEIRKYAQLRASGDKTLQPRLMMLELHRKRLVSDIAELAGNLTALDSKIKTYRKWLASSTNPGPKVKK